MNMNDNLQVKPSISVSQRWIVLGLVALALLVRLWALDSRSLWVDEVKLMQRAADFKPTMLVEPYFNPPLIYLIIGQWMRLSTDEVFLRVLPAVIGALTVWPVYILARRLFNPSVAALSGLLFVVSPSLTYYAQEINTYAFAILFGVVATWCYVRLATGGRAIWLWLCYSVSMMFALYTHTYMAFLPVVHAVSLLIWRKSARPWLPWILIYGLLSLLFLPRALPLLESLGPGGSATSWTELISPRLLTLGTAIPAVIAVFYNYVLGMTIEPLIPILPLIGLSVVAAGLPLLKTLRAPEKQATAFLWLTFMLPLTLALLISMTVSPIISAETPRYLVFYLPAFIILLARGLLLLNKVWQRTALVVLLIGAGLSLYNYYYRYDQVAMGGFRAVAEYVHSQAQPGDVLIHTSNASPTPERKVGTASRLPVNYYLGSALDSYAILDEASWRELEPKLANHNRLWMVFFNDTSMWQLARAQWKPAPPPKLPAWTEALLAAGYHPVSEREFPGRKYMRVILFMRKTQ